MGHRLVAVLLAMVAGCEDCSERQSLDVRTEAELDRVLGSSYATSVDAGVELLAALELELAPALEVTPTRLAEMAQVAEADVTAGEGQTTHALVRDRARARGLVGELLDRRVPIFWLNERDAGVEFVVELRDPSVFPRDAYPAWLPAPSDGIPCFRECQARAQRIVEKRALLKVLSADDRLRRLRKLKRDVDSFKPAPPAVRALVDMALARGLRPGSQLGFHRESAVPGLLRICGAGLSVDECRAMFDGGTCVPAEVCGARRCTDTASCGVEVSP